MKSARAFFAAAVSIVAMPVAVFADRAPVLKQIKVPHDYYYREMYLPQLTTGPSALSWSPDGQSLVYSMAGGLWKQRVDSTAAEEFTAGRGYDYQPDWSSDGKAVVFVRYLHDAMELCTLDTASGVVTQLTHGGDVNLEPRWSPDGSRIAFVSTQGTGRFHIFIGTFGKSGFSAVQWMPEHKSSIARYYYSPFDQQLSPTWSPDGRALIYIDNPEIGYGSGSLWRRPLDLSSPAQLIHREETNWKAAPDWSRDGKRVAYSSYVGQQVNQLWLVTAAGEDYPLPFDIGQGDDTRPRWSPDASRIAFISNANRNTEIRIQETVGGAQRVLDIGKRIYKRPMGTLELRIVDESGLAIPARVAVLGSDGRAYAPVGGNMRGDDSFDRDRQDFETHYFHTGTGNSTWQVTLPVGEAAITVWYGDGHAIAHAKRTIGANGVSQLDVKLHKLDTPPEFATWRSADVHDHMNYGGTYYTGPADLIAQAQAEDLDMVFNLVVNKEQRIPDIAYFAPKPDPLSTPTTLLAHSQEYHSSYWGHLGLLGLNDHYLIPGFAAYPYTTSASVYPDNAVVADLAHAQNALVGYVHPFDVAPDPEHDAVLTDELPIDVALGKVDYYEVVGFSNHRESASIWYRLLNCGFRLPAAGGTDAMTNYASLRGPVGLARVYALPASTGDTSLLGRERAWLAGLKAGHSMATNGPLIGFTVDGKMPGDEIELSSGTHTLQLRGWLRSLTGVDHLEVVVNGAVVKTIALQDKTSTDFADRVTVDRSGWILLRAWNDHATPDVFDLYPYATTTPVYVTVGGKPARSQADADFFLKWIAKARAFASANTDYNTPAERAAVLGHINSARQIFEQRKREAHSTQ